MAKNFIELRAKLSPEMQARAAGRAEAMLIETRLQELRKSGPLPQAAANQTTSLIHASISVLERCEAVYVSTLREYVNELGGELKLIASFPDGDIQVHPFVLQE